MTSTDTIGLATAACMLALAIVPPLVLRARYGARLKWLALGIASWAVALMLKAVVVGALTLAIPDAPAWAQGAWGGTISAACELGMAWLFLGRNLPAADVVAFGTGIGCFEVIFKMTLGVAAAQGQEPPAGPGPDGSVLALVAVAEHASTIVGHCATRVLVYLSKTHRRVAPALLAFTTFSLVDGSATYGAVAGWRWQAAEVYVPFVAGLVAVACVEAAAARAFWDAHERTRPAAAAPERDPDR